MGKKLCSSKMLFHFYTGKGKPSISASLNLNKSRKTKSWQWLVKAELTREKWKYEQLYVITSKIDPPSEKFAKISPIICRNNAPRHAHWWQVARRPPSWASWWWPWWWWWSIAGRRTREHVWHDMVAMPSSRANMHPWDEIAGRYKTHVQGCHVSRYRYGSEAGSWLGKAGHFGNARCQPEPPILRHFSVGRNLDHTIKPGPLDPYSPVADLVSGQFVF